MAKALGDPIRLQLMDVLRAEREGRVLRPNHGEGCGCEAGAAMTQEVGGDPA